MESQQVLSAHLAAYSEAVELGPPSAEQSGADDWYSDRMALFAEAEWDRALSQADPSELGLES